MFRSFLKVALRNLKKNKLVSFINIFGLGLSMSVGMMIMIRLQDQLSYDDFHPSASRTYRIISEYKKSNGEHWKMASTPLPLETKLESDFSDIEAAAVVYPALHGKATGEGKEIYLNGAFTGPSFFKIFGFTLAAGDPATALIKPNSIVISRSTAEKFFGIENPVGKIFTWENGSNFQVTGVLSEPVSKTHINYDVFASLSSVPTMEASGQLDAKSSGWYQLNAAYTYVLIKKEARLSNVRQQLKTLANNLNRDNKDGTVAFTTQAIGKITPGKESLANDRSGSSWNKFYFELGVALIILLAACFNYTNLTIARSLTRAKEVGIRKVSGANRSQVFVQYLVESVVLAFLALIFASVILSFIIRYAPFNDGYEFIPSTFHYNTTLVLASVGFTLFTGILAGVSPAWILSSFQPVRVLKNLTTARIMGKISIQKILIVFQYSLSLTILIFLVAFYRQFSFLGAYDPGFKRENVLVVPLNGIDKNLAVQKVSGIPGVHSVGALSTNFSGHFSGRNSPAWQAEKKEAISLNYYYADPAFIRDMQIRILAGSNFPLEAETETERYILINEKAAHALNLDYSKAVGQMLWINDSTQLQVAGIVKDFNYENAGTPVRPLALRSRKNAYNYLYVSTDNISRQSFADQVNGSMKTLSPTQTFTSSWLKEDLAENNSQTATISLLGYLAFIAFSIASLGLLGLVIYTVQVKRKEISIRKIIGASEKQLAGLLSKRFVNLLLISGVIAIPIGYTAGVLFLQNFSNRVPFGLGNAFLCFLVLLSIGLITIITQTWKAATANPIKDLKRE